MAVCCLAYFFFAGFFAAFFAGFFAMVTPLLRI
jgi:hypothetical protein